jgi:hypothetical protein
VSDNATLVLVTAAVVAIGGPAVLGVMGAVRSWNESRSNARGARARDWSLSISSMLLYILAFNLVFFIQELFLVLPKALTPGLRPTLYRGLVVAVVMLFAVFQFVLRPGIAFY